VPSVHKAMGNNGVMVIVTGVHSAPGKRHGISPTESRSPKSRNVCISQSRAFSIEHGAETK
jgi:hypothetical protein